MLWHCWLGVRKSIRPVKKLSDEVLVWFSVWIEVQIVCTWSSWCHCIHKPHHLLPHLNSDWFYLSGIGTGLPRLSWKRGRWTGIVVVVVISLINFVIASDAVQSKSKSTHFKPESSSKSVRKYWWNDSAFAYLFCVPVYSCYTCLLHSVYWSYL